GTANAFRGSVNSGPDHGLVPSAEVATGIRLSSAYKLGVSASGGGSVQSEFTRGNYGWLGLGALLRRDKTTLALEGEWTPKRNKFPTDPDEGGEYNGKELRLGLPRAPGARAPARPEGTLHQDPFLPPV